MQKSAATIRAWIRKITQTDFVFFLMPPLMILLIAGTVAQRYLGLYSAHKIFFSSFIVWAGPLPLPGGYTLLGILSVGLLLKFLFHSQWSREKTGIILTHLGTLILLTGGLLTAVTAREGFLLLSEGQQSAYVYDYTQRQIFIFENDILRHAIPFESKAERPANLPFAMQILSQCSNCRIQEQSLDSPDLKGMAQFMTLTAKEPETEPERNMPGVTLRIAGLENQQNGTYIAFEGMPKPIILEAQGRQYKIIFGKEQRLLPFAVRLENFERQLYPGTEKAKEYISNITIQDGALEWPAVISMNKPFRYKGYTLYQSSFEETPQADISILSVVENKGRIFPYIGALVISVGLFIHLVLIFRGRTAT